MAAALARRVRARQLTYYVCYIILISNKLEVDVANEQVIALTATTERPASTASGYAMLLVLLLAILADIYGISSLPRAEADAGRLLELLRGHWQIENGLHYVRDVTLGEDACQVRCDRAPATLAACRNAALNLLRHAGVTNVAAALRRHAMYPAQALALLGIALE